jgi:hypothetical protein
MDVAVSCTDSSLPGGQVDGYHFGSNAGLVAAFLSFNNWWGFSSHLAATDCPPTGTPFGRQDFGGLLLECGFSDASAIYVELYLTSNSIIITQTASGDRSFTQMKSWISTTKLSPTSAPTPSAGGTEAPLPSGVKPLKVLLPTDIVDASSECADQTKIPWTNPGLVKADSCTAPDMPNGQIFGYQMDSIADYNQAWANYNTWANFGPSSTDVCPPGKGQSQGGPGDWRGPRFPQRTGQVLECFSSGSGPVYVWTYPTENAFIVVQPPKSWSFSKLETWWENNSV